MNAQVTHGVEATAWECRDASSRCRKASVCHRACHTATHGGITLNAETRRLSLTIAHLDNHIDEAILLACVWRIHSSRIVHTRHAASNTDHADKYE